MNCDDWAQAFEGTYEAKEEAICHGCPKFSSKDLTRHGGGEDYTAEEIDGIVSDIEDIIDWEDAGFETDWSAYDFATCQLAVIWRNAEADIKRIHEGNIQALVKGFFK